MELITCQGFTLKELLSGILLGIGEHSFSEMAKKSRISAQSNALFGWLFLARSAAVKGPGEVTVYPKESAAASQCGGGQDWTNGWLVFIDRTTVQGETAASVDAGDEIIAIEPAIKPPSKVTTPFWQLHHRPTRQRRPAKQLLSARRRLAMFRGVQAAKRGLCRDQQLHRRRYLPRHVSGYRRQYSHPEPCGQRQRQSYVLPGDTLDDTRRVESIRIGLLMNSHDHISPLDDENTYVPAGQQITETNGQIGTTVLVSTEQLDVDFSKLTHRTYWQDNGRGKLSPDEISAQNGQ